MNDWVSINGEIMPAAEGTIPIYDRGFLYGDSVFETLRTYDSRPHALNQHLKRLRLSASRIAMDLEVTDDKLRRFIDQLLDTRPNQESYLRVIITRGDGEFGLAPNQPGKGPGKGRFFRAPWSSERARLVASPKAPPSFRARRRFASP